MPGSKRKPVQERIGVAVRRRREALKYSQDDFALHLDMHRSYYGALERGMKDLRLSTLERVCEGLGVPMWEVVKDAESQ